MSDTFANRFQSEQELHNWIISFYQNQLQYFLLNIGGVTKHRVKITSRLINATMRRYSQLLEKYSVTDW